MEAILSKKNSEIKMMKKEEIIKIVRESYAQIAKQGESCCSPFVSCCNGKNQAESISAKLGYSKEEIQSVTEGADLGLGCGNPTAIASLEPGETVIDLGSGAGFDCFLAAQKVGDNGKVIGIDMTDEMIERAVLIAQKGGYENVEFRQGEIERLPVGNCIADVVISNCVINLSPEKQKVFEEVHRVLKPGGRFMISDIVLGSELPNSIKSSIEAYIGCLAGAILKDDYLQALVRAGFQKVRVIREEPFPVELMLSTQTAIKENDEGNVDIKKYKNVVGSVLSIEVNGIKPGNNASQ